MVYKGKGNNKTKSYNLLAITCLPFTIFCLYLSDIFCSGLTPSKVGGNQTRTISKTAKTNKKEQVANT